jgi:hypothetical protein
MISHVTLISDIVGISITTRTSRYRNLLISCLTATYVLVLSTTILYPASIVTSINSSKIDRSVVTNFRISGFSAHTIYLSGSGGIKVGVPAKIIMSPLKIDIRSIQRQSDLLLGSIHIPRVILRPIDSHSQGGFDSIVIRECIIFTPFPLPDS